MNALAKTPRSTVKPRSVKPRKPRKPVKAPKVPRSLALEIAREAKRGDISIIRSLARPDAAIGTWEYHAHRLVEWFDGGMMGETPFEIFSPGIAKVPFSNFSSLPVVNCPGAGDCLTFCYSLKAWRYPAPLLRQVQNTLLLRTAAGRAIIAGAFAKIPAGNLRLFVDGDFSTVEEIFYFMELIRSRPEIDAYGYSKSWVQMLSAQLRGIAWPANYLLNLSSGSNHDAGTRLAVMQLPIVRGDFLAVPVERIHIKSKAYQSKKHPGFAAYRRAVQLAAPPRAFVCPGRCGECLPDGGQACGAERMRGIPIAIGIHK